MRKLLFVGALILTTAALAFSQDWDNPELFKRLDLEQAEVEQIRAIFEKTEKTIREARLEIDVLRAQLRKLLFQEEVNMREVERLLRQSLDWELKERMAQIERQVELRKLLGDAKYARLTEAFDRRQMQEQERRLREERQKAESERR